MKYRLERPVYVAQWMRASLCVVLACGAWVGSLQGQARRNSPASKIYISDVNGEAIINTGDAIEDLNKRSVYTAQGTIIETKKPRSPDDRGRHFSTMVYSNGTGAFFDADTRVEVKRFVQESFTPNRSDVEVEPSISQTQAFVSRGTVGLCTSKLVAGSNMTYQTPHGTINIRGRKVVIEAGPTTTKISMLEGDSTIRAGALDLGGHTLKSGEQATITSGAPGQPNQIKIERIPPQEAAQLDDKVAMACLAKKTVYFEVRERPTTEGEKTAAATAEGDEDAAAPVTAFNATSPTLVREIVPIPLVPVNLPTEFTVSPARIQATPERR